MLNVHSNSSQNQKRVHVEGPRQQDPRAQIIGGSQQAPALEAISNLLLSGVFDRHPKLKLACTEFKCHWGGGPAATARLHAGAGEPLRPRKEPL